MNMGDYQHELDTSGLSCPLPILRAKKSLAAMHHGEVIKVTATDPGAVKDFEAFCKQTGNALLDSGEAGGKFEFQIRKG
jgi:tRNA 2-thiouridine synthesizing protein A